MITTDTPLLIPPPRHLSRQPGVLDLLRSGIIHLSGPAVADLCFMAIQLQSRLVEISYQPWPIRAGLESAAVCLLIDPSISGGPEAYHLAITGESIEIRAGSPAGLFYGCQTLSQLLRQYGRFLPCLHIEDAPDFPVRGFMLDISRDRVPTMATLLALIDRLAEWKINHLQLYTEHTFAYTGHETVWQHASPLTGAEILQLDAYCRERFIDLVPNQASFGHMERWLKHPGYRSLAESPNGWMSSSGHSIPDPVTLNPLHPGSLDLVAKLYQDLLPHFRSRFFNINGDETFELGQGACREAVQARSKEAVYFEFLAKLNTLVQQSGRQMLYWADFYWQHPQACQHHPAGAIALEWGYEADHDFAGYTARLAEAGIPFYVCPGTSTWNTLLGRTGNTMTNILSAAESGRRNGALGLLNTDWGDNGSLAYLPVSYLGIAYGAAASWGVDQTHTLRLAEALSLHAFGDLTGETGRIAYDLGNAYCVSDLQGHNSAAPFWFLVKNKLSGWPTRKVEAAQFQHSLEYVSSVSVRWSRAQPTGSEAALVRDEYANNTAMWQHACHCGLADLEEKAGGRPNWPALAEELQHIVSEHQRLWLARHRPGGLADSTARLASRLPYYEAKMSWG